MKVKRIKGKIAAAALLLALTLPPAAHGRSDGFFNNAGGVRNGDNVSWNDVNSFGNGVSWNGVNGDGAAWNGMEDETPVGGGLLVLTAAGACYAAARVKRLKIKE